MNALRLPRRRGKVAASAKSNPPEWPRLTAAQFNRLTNFQKTAHYFATSVDRLWQARFHNDARAALEWYSEQLAIRDGQRRRGELA